MIKRLIEKQVLQQLQDKRKIVVLLGARQVGKTTLLRKIVEALPDNKEILNGDFADDQQRLRPERASLTRVVSHLQYLFIDEAQNIPEIGRILKLIHDEFPKVRVMATGSSAFDLSERTGEPLTGRQARFTMYPISFEEQYTTASASENIAFNSMLYGSYPEVLQLEAPTEKISYLKNLVADYLLKDLYVQVDISRAKLMEVLRLLAFQIGSEVSYNELANSSQLDAKTVARYISLLERNFVLVRVGAFSRNLRKEVSKSQKIYFWDLGVRNAIINAFNPPELRNDLGALWENYLFSERLKKCAYHKIDAQHFFWRTYDKKEIDLVEESSTALNAFEFKLRHKSDQKRAKFPKLWLENYPQSRPELISLENFSNFLI